MAPTVQLMLYRFGPDANFEGQLLGALERLESGGTLRILELLFVAKDGASGELSIVGIRGDGAGGIVAPVLDFRLDPASRRRATQRALSNGTPSLPADVLRELGEALEPGGALAAVLVEHVWARALQDAVSRTGRAAFRGAFVDATTFADLAPDLLAAARAPSESPVDG
jgi:hypothetical protein